MPCGCRQSRSVPTLTPEQNAERDARLRQLAEDQEKLREQRNEEHRLAREARLYSRRRGR